MSKEIGLINRKPVGLFSEKLFLHDSKTWMRLRCHKKRNLIGFNLEITARCNLNCRHCYINLPAADTKAKKSELSLPEIKEIIDKAVSLGALWCLITGGEPLLRKDFSDIYLYAKKRGLLVSVFTNATLINQEYVSLFKKYPPRDIEITVYGATEKTYEKITRKKGSFNVFMRGLNILLKNNLKVRFKTLAMRSNLRELPKIADFCRKRTKDFFRFDPFLNLRYDFNEARNREIKSERLSPEEIVMIERQDPQRALALRVNCKSLIKPSLAKYRNNFLFPCGAGNSTFTVSYDGFFRLCPVLWHPKGIYNFRDKGFVENWGSFVKKVRQIRSNNKDFLKRCRVCELFNLCMWCPGHSYLETGEMDTPVEYFCEVARARKVLVNSLASSKG